MPVLELGDMVSLDTQGVTRFDARADRAIQQARALTSVQKPQGEPRKGLKSGQQGLFATPLKAEWGGCRLESHCRVGVLLGDC